LKSDGCIHIVAKHSLSGFEIAVKDALDGFAQESLAESPDRAAPAREWFR
jgi:hypothetical protein